MSDYTNNIPEGVNRKVTEPIPVDIVSTKIPDKKISQKEDDVSKRDEKLTKALENVSTKTAEVFGKVSDNIIPAMLGPLNLALGPLEELTGVNIIDGLKKGIGGIFKPKKGPKASKKSKMKPSKNDVAIKGDPGSLLIVDTIEKAGMDAKKGEGGLFDKLGARLNIDPATLKSLVMKGGAILAIAGGIVWGVVDAFKAVSKAGDWGTSKVSAGIAGFIAGTGSGWSNAFKNAGKWALIGAGTGFLVGGPIGAIIGGVIGGAIGGILGFIGGAKIAQGFDKVVAFLKKLWNSGPIQLLRDSLVSVVKLVMSPFVGMWNAIEKIIEKLKVIWGDEDATFMQKLGRTFVELFTAIPRIIWGGIKGLVNGVWNYLKDLFVDQKDPITGKVKKSIASRFGSFMWTIVKGIWGGLQELFKGIWSGITNTMSSGVQFLNDFLIKPIGDFFASAWVALKEKGSSIADFFEEYVINPVKGFFEAVVFKVQDALFFLTRKNVFDSTETKRAKGQAADILESNDQGLLNDILLKSGLTTNANLESLSIERLLFENPELMARIKRIGISAILSEGDQSPISTTSVQDAIIRRDGSIIHTSPEDNIIATKNEPAQMGGSLDIGRVESLLSSMLEVLKTLSLTPVVVNQPSNNKDLSRILFDVVGE